MKVERPAAGRGGAALRARTGVSCAAPHRGILGVIAAATLLVVSAACTTIGSDYKRPATAVPANYKEVAPWREAAPQDAVGKGAWWEVFGDRVLNDLQARAHAGSPRLQIAAARVEQARALAGLNAASTLPVIELSPDAARFRVSGNRPDQPSKVPGNVEYTTNRFRLPLYASYELDLWGRIKRLQQAADARVLASQSAYHNVLLALEGDLCATYFALRLAEEDLRILNDNLELRRKARDLIAARKRNGLATEYDVARVETELALTQGEAQVAGRRRAEYEHALAVLVGEPPAQFTLAPERAALKAPTIPLGMPADLLERRPDVAEAERLLAARNAEIGAAKAAFFPAIRLTGALGFESAEFSDLLKGDSFIWGLAAGLSQPLFDGGRIRANRDRAEAAWRENLGSYRERLLVAFREVEDALAGLRYLGEQQQSVDTAVTNARRAEQLATSRYRNGLVTVLDVVDSQRARLLAERQQSIVLHQQLLASVALVKALGGGWEGRGETTRVAGAASAHRTTP